MKSSSVVFAILATLNTIILLPIAGLSLLPIMFFGVDGNGGHSGALQFARASYTLFLFSLILGIVAGWQLAGWKVVSEKKDLKMWGFAVFLPYAFLLIWLLGVFKSAGFGW